MATHFYNFIVVVEVVYKNISQTRIQTQNSFLKTRTCNMQTNRHTTAILQVTVLPFPRSSFALQWRRAQDAGKQSRDLQNRILWRNREAVTLTQHRQSTIRAVTRFSNTVFHLSNHILRNVILYQAYLQIRTALFDTSNCSYTNAQILRSQQISVRSNLSLEGGHKTFCHAIFSLKFVCSPVPIFRLVVAQQLTISREEVVKHKKERERDINDP